MSWDSGAGTEGAGVRHVLRMTKWVLTPSSILSSLGVKDLKDLGRQENLWFLGRLVIKPPSPGWA